MEELRTENGTQSKGDPAAPSQDYARSINFFKIEGTGNDFIVVDWRGSGTLGHLAAARLGRAWCDRRRGIGGDGLLLIEDTRDDAPGLAYMRVINADGSEGEMCGNGARCAARLLHLLGGPERFTLQTCVGAHKIQVSPESVRVTFPDIPARPVKMHLTLPEIGEIDLWSIDTGVPHAVIFTDGPPVEKPLEKIAPPIRRHQEFPRGTNVNLALADPQLIPMRTWERGVENETFACGTGAVAVACCILHQAGQTHPSAVFLNPPGGKLIVHAEPHEGGFRNVVLEGPARIVFQGSIELDPALLSEE